MIKYKVKVNGVNYNIEMEDTDDVSEIKEININGEKHSVYLDSENLSTIMLDNNTHKINGIYEYNGEIVKLLIGKDYNTIELEEDRPIKRQNKISKSKKAIISAPMPGKIISIKIKQNEKVKEGQVLLILEAMKMENSVKSPRTGVVKELKILEGASCNAGDKLLVIE